MIGNDGNKPDFRNTCNKTIQPSKLIYHTMQSLFLRGKNVLWLCR